MTCRECIHFEVCGKPTLKLEVCEYGSCPHFADKLSHEETEEERGTDGT